VVTHPTLVSTFVGQLLSFRPVIHLVINNVPVDYRFLKKLLVKFITIGFEFQNLITELDDLIFIQRGYES
jgi:hypothetical protein